MLLAVTGSSGGKTKRTVVTITYTIPIYHNINMISRAPPRYHRVNLGWMRRTILHTHPQIPGSLNARSSGNIFRPRRQLIAGGIAYETPSATTEAEMMALKALLEPRNIQPKIM